MKKTLAAATLAVGIVASPPLTTAVHAIDIIIILPPPPPPPVDPVAGVVKKMKFIKKFAKGAGIYGGAVLADTFASAMVANRCENREIEGPSWTPVLNFIEVLESCRKFAQKFPKKYLANMNRPWVKAISQWTTQDYRRFWSRSGGA